MSPTCGMLLWTTHTQLTASAIVADAADAAESSLSLDPVGVFLQSSEAVAGGIFSGMRDLLQCGVDRATPEQPDEQPCDLPQGEDDMPSRAVGSDAQRRKCARKSQPINEYTHNADLIYGAFWYLFPLRSGLQRCGPVATADSRHMFTQFHNVFAKKHNFLFFMANQVQRHQAARGVALRVKTDPWSFEAFAAMVSNADEYLEKLRVAEEDPTSKEARGLLTHVMRFVASAGKTVPWSGEERASEITKLYAMCRRFGAPSGFLTVAPDDVHQPRMILLSYRAGKPDAFPACADTLLPVVRGQASAEDVGAFCAASLQAAPDQSFQFRLDETFLQRLATMNPVATTLFYKSLVEAIFTELVGMPPSHKRNISCASRSAERPKGFLGTNFGWSYVNDTNARKSLHFHAAVHGGPSPALLADVAGYRRLETAVYRALDSIYRAEVPIELHAVDVARRLLKCPAPKHTFHQPTITECDADTLAFDREADSIALHTGFHSHAATCRKGASGKKGCRMARPAGHPVPATRLLSITNVTAAVAVPEPSSADEDEQENVEWACPLCAETTTSARDAAARVRARRAEVGDAHVTGLCFSHELKRPQLDDAASTSNALRDILRMTSEEAAELEPADALARVQNVVNDVEQWLPRTFLARDCKRRCVIWKLARRSPSSLLGAAWPAATRTWWSSAASSAGASAPTQLLSCWVPATPPREHLCIC